MPLVSQLSYHSAVEEILIRGAVLMGAYYGAMLHMKRWLIKVGLALAVLVAAVVAAGYLATMQVVGHVAPAFRSVPPDYGLHAEVVSFQSLDGIGLKGWWIPAQGTGPVRP